MKLQNGSIFPSITVTTINHGTVSLPTHMRGQFGVILFYRGSWCPYCNAQLAAFARAGEQFGQLGIQVVAVSVDDADTTRATGEKRRISFPLGYGADAKLLAELTGAYLSSDESYLESTGFLLDPDGRIVISVYSSNAIGRLLPEDVLGFLKHMRDAV